MKHLFFAVWAIAFGIPFIGISQMNTKDSIDAVKQELLIKAYDNRNDRKVIDHDKSFVSDSRLYYESLGGVPSRNDFSDRDLVEKTLRRYIEGSSYNRLDMLKNAFAEDATLYLTINGEFKTLSPEEEYLSFLKGKPGEFNGRTGKILTMDITGDIATAKAEILITGRNMRFIDLFLLKKTGRNWKIISKTATQTAIEEAE